MTPKTNHGCRIEQHQHHRECLTIMTCAPFTIMMKHTSEMRSSHKLHSNQNMYHSRKSKSHQPMQRTMKSSALTDNNNIQTLAKSRSLRLQRIALIATALVLSSPVASFTLPTPITQHRSPVRSQTCCAAAAASAWLFTPERTGAILADTVSDAALKASQVAADVALDAAIVTTDTVVKTVYKSPFLSLALSFLFGGLFFSTVAAGVAAAYAFGKENTRRFKEVAGILWKRNWQVFMMSLAVTKVSASCSVRSLFLFTLHKDFGS